MTQLTEEPIWRSGGPWTIRRKRPMAAATLFIRMGAVGLDANGRAARMVAGSPGLSVLGVSEFTFDNTAGAGSAKDLDILAGLFGFNNSGSTDAIANTVAPGTQLFFADDNTLALTDNNGTRAGGAAFEFVDEKGIVWAWVGVPFRGIQLAVFSLTIGEADLTAAATSQSINIGDPLPVPCRVLGVSEGEGTFTAFAGGSVSAATLKIGTGSDDDALRTAEDIFTGATGFSKPGTAGVLGYAGAPLPAGTQLKAKVTTTGDNVVNLTAGAITTRVLLALGV